MAEKAAGVKHAREAYWTEAFAVGDPDWLKGVYSKFKFKRKKIIQAYKMDESSAPP